MGEKDQPNRAMREIIEGDYDCQVLIVTRSVTPEDIEPDDQDLHDSEYMRELQEKMKQIGIGKCTPWIHTINLEELGRMKKLLPLPTLFLFPPQFQMHRGKFDEFPVLENYPQITIPEMRLREEEMIEQVANNVIETLRRFGLIQELPADTSF